MKITKLSFNNINSLSNNQNGFVIDFTEPIFAGEGLFAIVGPNGAGKSTILEAISYALFRKSARYGAQAKNTIHILTTGKKKCFIELEFEALSQYWKVRLEVEKTTKRSGEEGDIKENHYLWRLNSNGDGLYIMVAETLREVENYIKTELRLNYKHFSRSIILEQGAFDSFLVAESSEKAKLLSQITGGEIYKIISQKVYERFKNEKDIYEHQKSILGTIELLTPEKIEEIQNSIANAEQNIELFKNQQSRFGEQHTFLAYCMTLKDKQHAAQSANESIQNEWNSRQPQFEAVAKHQQLEPFWRDYKESERMQEEIQKLKENQTLKENEQKQINTLLQNAQTTQQKAQQNLERATQENDDKQPVLGQASILEAKLEEKDKDIGETREKYTLVASQKNKLTADIEKLCSEAKQLQGQINEIENYIQKHDNHKDLASLEDIIIQNAENHFKIIEQIKQTESEISDLKEKQKNLHKEQQDLNQKQTLPKEENSDVQNRLNNSLQKQKALYITTESFENAEKEALSLTQALNQLTFLYELANQYSSEKAVRESLCHQLNTKTELIETLVQDIQQLKEKHQSLNGQLQDKETISKQQQLIKNFEDHRTNLVSGQPCPLCGALEHPFVLDYHPADTDELQKSINQLKQSIQKIADELLTTEKKQSSEQASQQSIQKQLQDTEGKIHTLGQNFESKYQELKSLKPEIELQIDDFTAIGTLKKSLETTLKDENQKINTYKQEIQEYNKLNEKLIQLQKKINEIELEHNKIGNELKIIQSKQDNLNEKLQNQQAQSAGTSAQLKEYIEKYQLETPKAEKLKDWEQQIKNLAQVYNEKSSLKTECEKKIQNQKESKIEAEVVLKQVSEKLQQIENEGFALKKEIETLNKEKVELIGNKTVASLREHLKKELEKARQELKHADEDLNKYKLKQNEIQTQLQTTIQRITDESLQYDQHISHLLASLLPHQINSIEQFKKSRLPQSEVEQITELQKKLEDQKIQALTLLQKANEELLTHLNARPQELPDDQDDKILLDNIILQQKDIENKITQLIQDKQTQKVMLEKDEETRRKKEEQQQQFAIQEKEYAKWEILNKLIGSSEGDKFNRFAQSLTLNILTELSNRHLATLSDRYILDSSDSVEKELNLMVLDMYQGNSKRSIQSLSGGEKFLLSLALALGLSDLSSGNQKIETLFIDEGFGALDGKNLELAYQTLVRLQSTGRMIGIITHVESMIDRINVKIELERSATGFTNIRLPEFA